MSSTREMMVRPDTVSSGKPTRQRLVVIVVMLVTTTVAYLDRVNVSVLAASDGFLVDMGIKGRPVQIGLMMTLFLLTYGISNFTLSFLGDVFGPRKITATAVFIWLLSMVVGGCARSFNTILGSRFVLGVGEGMYHPMQSKYVKQWFPPKERGRANAVWSVGMSIAPAMAMPFFAWTISSFSWRASFFICAVLGAIPLYLVWFHTADSPRHHKGVNELELRHIEEGMAQETVVAQGPSMAAIWSSAKLVVKNYRVWVLLVYWICYNVCYWGILMWLPSYLKSARGFSWTQMGLLSSLPFVLALMAKIVSGWAADRIGRSAPFCVAAMLGVALGVYFGEGVHSNIASGVLLALGMGATGLGIPTFFALMQGLVPAKAMSFTHGTMNGIGTGISSLSPAVIGFCISLTGGYSGGLFFVVGAALLGALAALVLAIQKY